MPVSTIKFSQFAAGGAMEVGDTLAGLRDGINTLIDSNPYVGLPLFSVTTLTQQMFPNSGYVTNNMGLITFTLPVICPFGSIIEVIGFSAGGWKINQNAGQQIFVGVTATTQGVSGSISSSNPRDSIALLCVVANTSFVNLTPPQGNPLAT